MNNRIQEVAPKEPKHPFEYQAPTPEMVEQITLVRERCKQLYELLTLLPNSRERSVAITKLEEVSMWANKAIVFDAAPPPHFATR